MKDRDALHVEHRSQTMAELIVLFLAAFAFYVSLSFGIATLSSQGLTLFVGGVLMMQHIVVVGKLLAQRLPASSGRSLFSSIFQYLSIVNLEIDMFKPGCAVGKISFLTIYFITVAMCIGISIAFTCSRSCSEPWSSNRPTSARQLRRRRRDDSMHRVQSLRPNCLSTSSHW